MLSDLSDPPDDHGNLQNKESDEQPACWLTLAQIAKSYYSAA